MRNRFSDFAITVGAVFIPALESVVAKLEPLIDGFAEFAENNPEVVKALGVTAALAVTVIGHCAIWASAWEPRLRRSRLRLSRPLARLLSWPSSGLYWLGRC